MLSRKPFALAGLLLSVLLAPSYIAVGAEPPTIDDLAVLSAPEVKQMMERGEVTVVNSLSRVEFTIQRIPGSINIPVTEMEGSPLLPEDRAAAIVFYCMGQRCTYSGRATAKAVAMGYTHAYWFKGGLPEWRRFGYPIAGESGLRDIKVKKLSPRRLQEASRRDAPTLLDVRPLWWNQSDAVLPGSLFIPLIELHQRYGEIPKGRPVIIVDGAMMQSPSAARFLTAKGFTVLGVLKGGILRWEHEGYPSTRRNETATVP